VKKYCILLSVLLAAFFSTVPSFAQYWGKIKYVHSTTNIRAERSTDSRVVGQLMAGEKIKVDFLKDNWFAIFKVVETLRDEDRALGYVLAPLLKPTPSGQKKPLKKTLSTLKYKIVERQDTSSGGTQRMVCRVLVEIDHKPSKTQLKHLATKLWRSGNTRWEEFFVFMYLPGMNTEGFAYGVAEFQPSGLKTFRVQNIDY
jgi:uncharacterized protein YgiM (DUF1202 family)